MERKFFVLSTILLLAGCISNKVIDENTVAGTWRLYDVVSKNESDSDFLASVVMKKVLKDGALICFFTDGVYSEITGSNEFFSGDWKLKADIKSISLSPKGRKKDGNKVKIEKDRENQNSMILSIEKENLVFKYTRESKALSKPSEDPFYPENNKWRIKPTEFEGSSELSNRLSNYLKHLALLLKAVKERDQSVVSFEFSQGPVKIYNGGIGIHPYEIVPQIWKNSFYDDKSAFTTYMLYKDYLEVSHYRGAATGQWIVDDYNILVSVYSDFNQNAKQ